MQQSGRYFIYLFIYYQFTKQEGTHKRQSLSKVSAYKKTNIHTPTTTPNNAQQIQTTKTGSCLISLHISDHKGDARKNFDCCSQGYSVDNCTGINC